MGEAEDKEKMLKTGAEPQRGRETTNALEQGRTEVREGETRREQAANQGCFEEKPNKKVETEFPGADEEKLTR